MSVISMKQLLEAGVHFGHQTRRWNPKMAPYIYTERNGIYIIDLQKTVGLIDDAFDAIADVAAQGGTILFVGTKKQAQEAIKTEAERCGMFYVNERWLGGMLTNFKTIQSRIKRLKEIEKMIKTLSNIFKQDKEKFVIPRSVQQVIPIETIWSDGIFKIGRNKFAKTYKFTDINYAVASRVDQETMFLEYMDLLNSFDCGGTTKITINNRRLN